MRKPCGRLMHKLCALLLFWQLISDSIESITTFQSKIIILSLFTGLASCCYLSVVLLFRDFFSFHIFSFSVLFICFVFNICFFIARVLFRLQFTCTYRKDNLNRKCYLVIFMHKLDFMP